MGTTLTYISGLLFFLTVVILIFVAIVWDPAPYRVATVLSNVQLVLHVVRDAIDQQQQQPEVCPPGGLASDVHLINRFSSQ